MLEEKSPPFGVSTPVVRSFEQARMLHVLDEGGPKLLYLHGIAGVGKSALLAAFAATARSEGVTVVGLDCRSIEPTERGFLHSLALAIGSRARSLASLTLRLSNLGDRVVLTMDTYEVFRFLDVWLRETFVPALPANVRVVLCGREPAESAWLTSRSLL